MKEFSRFFFSSWDNEVNEEDVLTVKYPSLSSIDWNVLARVDTQMEEALEQCKQDFVQYDQFFQNVIKEVSVLLTIVFPFIVCFLF